MKAAGIGSRILRTFFNAHRYNSLSTVLFQFSYGGMGAL
jgi:hypothetical protein